jgi:hypothetical protein
MKNMNLSLIVEMVDKMSGPAQKINSITRKLGANVLKTQQELSKFGQQKIDFKAFVDLKNHAKNTQKEMALAQITTANLAKEIKKTSGHSKKINQQF